jgi:hypothetical protein
MTRRLHLSIPGAVAAVGSKAVTTALNFVREHTPESCTRLCAVLCCVTGCGCAVGTLAFAFVNPGAPTTVGALVGETTALIAAGCVALLTRTTKREDAADSGDSGGSAAASLVMTQRGAA